MVNPGGTGRPSTDVISARFAPLPPSRSFISIGGLRWVWSKSKTNGIGKGLLGGYGVGNDQRTACAPTRKPTPGPSLRRTSRHRRAHGRSLRRAVGPAGHPVGRRRAGPHPVSYTHLTLP